MKEVVVSMLRCPTCLHEKLDAEIFDAKEDRIVNGVLWCSSCGTWYPVEDELLELLPINLGYIDDRIQFEKKYKSRLNELNLRPFSDLQGPQPVSDELVKGFAKITFTARLGLDYKEQWNKTAFSNFLHKMYSKYIEKAFIEKHWDRLSGEVNELHDIATKIFDFNK